MQLVKHYFLAKLKDKCVFYDMFAILWSKYHQDELWRTHERTDERTGWLYRSLRFATRDQLTIQILLQWLKYVQQFNLWKIWKDIFYLTIFSVFLELLWNFYGTFRPRLGLNPMNMQIYINLLRSQRPTNVETLTFANSSLYLNYSGLLRSILRM